MVLNYVLEDLKSCSDVFGALSNEIIVTNKNSFKNGVMANERVV